MKKLVILTVMLSICLLTDTVLATAKSWVSTRYKPDVWSTGSSYRSPVTQGHLDIRLLIEDATFTEAVFTIKYDTSIVDTIGTGNVQDIRTGLALASVITENLEGTWKKSTITLSGDITIGSIQYESDALFRIRFIPVGEGTMPVTLWPAARFPQSYNTCSLTLTNGIEEVQHERKDWNDGTTLFTFTDKTSAKVMYHYDMNFGTAVQGYLRVVYNDDSVVEFHESDHAKGITINPEMGAYFLTAQPDALSHSMIFPGYDNWESMDLVNGYSWSSSHSQPSGFFEVPEQNEGFHGFRASSADLVMTIGQMDIGTNFESSGYIAALAGDQGGILSKNFTFAYVDDDNVRLTIEGGLEPDYYNLYVYKDGNVLGRTWFDASEYYPATITVKDENDQPLEGAEVVIPYCFFECMYIREITNAQGQAVFEVPGNPDWGQYYDLRVLHDGYENSVDSFEVYDQGPEVNIIMIPAVSYSLENFASFAGQWLMQDCLWSGDCEGADMNIDGTVDIQDMVLFFNRWLKDN
ncbi:MAG: hypothetical protein JEZ07_07890 [Phycisphaerae bacterium]|nr:hypothetical protein [Phycisphaerae bacterium]